MPLFTIERNWIDVIGLGWYSQSMAQTIKLGEYDIKNIGELNRESITHWLDTHAGDFQIIKDFSAHIKDVVVEWKYPDSEDTFNSIMGE